RNHGSREGGGQECVSGGARGGNERAGAQDAEDGKQYCLESTGFQVAGLRQAASQFRSAWPMEKAAHPNRNSKAITPRMNRMAKNQSARRAWVGFSRWARSSSTLRRLAFQAKSNKSPRRGTSPTTASRAMLKPMRSKVTRGAPILAETTSI